MRMNTPLQRRLERGPLSPRSSVGHGGALVASGAVAVNSMNALERQRMHRFGARLRNFLKLAKPYKWVCYEWFYANLDKYVPHPGRYVYLLSISLYLSRYL